MFDKKETRTATSRFFRQQRVILSIYTNYHTNINYKETDKIIELHNKSSLSPVSK